MALSTSAAEQVERREELNSANRAAMTQFKAPVFPAAAVDAGVTAVVHATLHVDKLGRVREVSAMRSDPASPMIEDSVRAAVRAWKFIVPMRGCAPLESVQEIRVVFDVVDGDRRVTVSRVRTAPKSWQDHPLVAVNRDEAGARNFRYPARARAQDIEAGIYLRVSVDGGGMLVALDVSAHAVSHGAESFADAFIDNAKKVVSAYRFRPMPDLKEPVIVGCQLIEYALVD